MRIISGNLKGRRLNTPRNNKIRPTTDKVKESIFSMLMPYIEDAVVIDLFSGTGNLGLEAISRGAKHCYFGDNERESLLLTKDNIIYCKVENQATIISGEFERVLERISEKADVIFLDPPYKAGLLERCLKKIEELSILSEDGVIVIEHGKREILEDQIGIFTKMKEKRYGTILVSVFNISKK
ncbi:MAG: 16S rRNA (guanine(966)-N(2))-methyltransferase RsmD [Peptostreptococcaceae bacterium]|nr:16S rRNA (guanine(966)-N(2))-methyltransferase RsmD [Peptostreptococcaceae bacterium]